METLREQREKEKIISELSGELRNLGVAFEPYHGAHPRLPAPRGRRRGAWEAAERLTVRRVGVMGGCSRLVEGLLWQLAALACGSLAAG